MPVINDKRYQEFVDRKNLLTWEQAEQYQPGHGVVPLMVWRGYLNITSSRSPFPYYFVVAEKTPGGWNAFLHFNEMRQTDGRGKKLIANEYGPDLASMLQSAYDITDVKELEVQSATESPIKLAFQPGGNWYNGALPNPKELEKYVGGGNVDASQLQSTFGGVGKALQLVNAFDASLLRSIAFIFNTSGNAYGVYVPAMDDAINREKAKTILKGKGYLVNEMPNGDFTAQSKDGNVPGEQIQREIQSIEANLKSQGGHMFGINMNRVLESAKADMAKVQQKTSQDFEFLATIHLGETMAHEATHAQGHSDEAAPQGKQLAFVEAVTRPGSPLQQERMQLWLSENKDKGASPDQYIPLQATGGLAYASAVTMKKKAQHGAQFTHQAPQREGGIAPWAGMFWNEQGKPIETMLGKTHHPDQYKKDSIEMRMRRQRQENIDERPDLSQTTEVLLEEGRRHSEAYSAMETLMEDRRPKPLVLPQEAPAKTAATRLPIRTAYSDDDGLDEAFGWMNNLDLPISERVIDEPRQNDTLSFDWDKMPEVTRYNPEYDHRGVFYQVFEPRFEPETWENMVQDRSSTSPARRFAAKVQSAGFITGLLKLAVGGILTGKFQATRFLISSSLLRSVEQLFNDEQTVAHILQPVGKHKKSTVYPVWVSSPDVTDEKIFLAERYVLGEDESEMSATTFDEITNLGKIKKAAIGEILAKSKEIIQHNGLQGVYLVGGFPRSLAMGDEWSNIRDLDFSSAWPEECVKLGGLLAEALGVKHHEYYHRTMTMTWVWRGIKCDFRGYEAPRFARDLLREKNLPVTPLNLDVFSRDLTVNMLVYDLKDSKVYDVTKESVRDLKGKVLRTYFEPDKVLPQNPIVILRTLKYAARYDFTIDPKLSESMKSHAGLLFKTVTPDRLEKGLEDILREGKSKGKKLIEEYGLQKLFEIGKYASD